jgi:hypothetical protein
MCKREWVLTGTSVRTAGWTSHVPVTTDSVGNWNIVHTIPPLNSSRQLRILKRENIYIEMRRSCLLSSVFPHQTTWLVFINSVGIVVYLLRFY